MKKPNPTESMSVNKNAVLWTGVMTGIERSLLFEILLQSKRNPNDMKVLIRVTRKTEYATIVEMTQETYDRLNEQLESSEYARRKAAEKELNNLIDTKDWQDDELDDLEEFRPIKEGE